MIGTVSICLACQRLRDNWKCVAFPEGIPDDIRANGFDHREEHAGDNGVRFLLAPELADVLAAYEAKEGA